MKICFGVVILLTASMMTQVVAAEQSSGLCGPLRTFISAVKPDETKSFVFRTSWGANFNNESEAVLSASRCETNGEPAANEVCLYLMKHASAEFSSIVVEQAISCLLPTTQFDGKLSIESGSFSITYGTEDSGALVNISLNEDRKVGGMAFTVTADGY